MFPLRTRYLLLLVLVSISLVAAKKKSKRADKDAECTGAWIAANGYSHRPFDLEAYRQWVASQNYPTLSNQSVDVILRGKVSQARLFDLFESRMKSLFGEHPPYENHEAKDNDPTIYAAFNPVAYFSDMSPMITPEVVKGLRSGKKALSIGVGQAYLEQGLVMGLGVPPEAIALNDVADHGVPAGLAFHQFDCRTQWPSGIGKFDYILFPQSLVTVETHIPGLGEGNPRLEIYKETLKHLNPGGQVRIAAVNAINQTEMSELRKLYPGIKIEEDIFYANITLPDR